MSKIKKLPQHIANQIAAGEVVERPASVVKELVENAIDANASQIEIVLVDGGKELIEVFDNGSGMTKDDLKLCIEPHATSKIYTQEDLFAIKTLGFRGEALASIASVSRFSVASRPRGKDSQGWEIKVDFGRFKRVQPSACPEGTLVQVKDLFLEVPARLKFLKGAQSEYLRCLSMIHLFCVAWPEIGFKLKRNKKIVLNKKQNEDVEDRIELLIGKKNIDYLIKVKNKINAVSLNGFIGDPDEIRVSSRNFHFFLNRRPITSPVLWKAINEAFKGYMVKGNYPTGVLFLDIDPSLVDVNVHPSKSEVRFENAQDIFRLIYHSVKNGLEKKHTKGLNFHSFQKDEESSALFVKEEVPLPWEQYTPKRMEMPLNKASSETSIDGKYQGKDYDFYLLGQFANSYIVYEKEKELFILDQHAAHEAIIFKRLMDEFERKGNIERQRLLFPIVLELLPHELQKILDGVNVLKNAGIEIEEFGSREVIVSALPTIFSSEGDYYSFIYELLKPFIEGEKPSEKELYRDIFSKMACAIAIKANKKLQKEQMISLVKEVYEVGVTNCPHGRPILKSIGLSELEKKFFRK